ncbi:N-acetylmuramoyl-L-alanine amidase [Streptomyces sp. NPDC005438]|uniref:N-acetylmuramoyl-L-alanine amidase n=1 Tax=Streptomyces sp. NPDC005438 TaxID=3156880 RepID=UPI0033B36D21
MLAGAAVVAATALAVPLLGSSTSAASEDKSSDSLQRAFDEAASEYDVPLSVLQGVSYLQSRWDAHAGQPSVTGGYGPMHLTDAAHAVAQDRGPAHSHTDGEDPRGDLARPLGELKEPEVPSERGKTPARLRTLTTAAELTGESAQRLRTEPSANIRGGAALLAKAQKDAGRKLSADPADWFGAVARYSGSSDRAGAEAYAREVFSVIRSGEQRTTTEGQRVRLAARPQLRADGAQLNGLGLKRAAGRADQVECPKSLGCEWIPAPYEEFEDDEGEQTYGNHDRADRPKKPGIDYIVIHDTEAAYEGTVNMVQDPTYVSWHYTLRAADGHVAQHVPLKHVAWHAGNWHVNTHSIGLEHEGFLVDPDAWFTEAMYRSSARLVRHLADKYDVPLDREHVIGHDNVPGTSPANIPGMHTDPGPYWDWDHYFRLLGKPLKPKPAKKGQLVTIKPEYDKNKPTYTECDDSGKKCPAHGSGAVRLHAKPDSSAPLVKDIGLRPGGEDSTTGVNDVGARASTGQTYAYAGREGEWTAIWYLGQKAWFHNPDKQPTAVRTKGRTLAPKKDDVPVYGVAYPEESAYPEGVPVQKPEALPYKLKADQRYAAGPKSRGTYFYAQEFDPDGKKYRVVKGKEKYYQIQVGHRIGYVKASDVSVR